MLMKNIILSIALLTIGPVYSAAEISVEASEHKLATPFTLVTNRCIVKHSDPADMKALGCPSQYDVCTL